MFKVYSVNNIMYFLFLWFCLRMWVKLVFLFIVVNGGILKGYFEVSVKGKKVV